MSTPSIPTTHAYRLGFPERTFHTEIDAEGRENFVFDDGMPPPSETAVQARMETIMTRWEAEQLINQAPPPITPWELTRWMRKAGVYETFMQIKAGLPEPQKTEVDDAWDKATEFDVNHPMLVQMCTILGMSTEQRYQAWKDAAADRA